MQINLTFEKDIFRILLISDTHIYRTGQHLPVFVMNAFQENSPDLILHCGDICTMDFIDELQKIAPVYAVRGNRDLLNWFRLPDMIDLNINGFRIHMEHGQGGLFSYLAVKTEFTLLKLLGKQPDYSRAVRFKDNYREFDLYCVGHSHSRFMTKKDRTILINPGHMNFENPEKEHEAPSFSLIEVGKESLRINVMIIENEKISCDSGYFSR